MNAYNISNDECIHFAQQPLERNTYDKLILKIAHSGMMLMTSFCRCKLYPKIIAHDWRWWANCKKRFASCSHFYSCHQSFGLEHEFLQLWVHCLQSACNQGKGDAKHGQDWFWHQCQKNPGWLFGISWASHQFIPASPSSLLKWQQWVKVTFMRCMHVLTLFNLHHPFIIQQPLLSRICSFTSSAESAANHLPPAVKQNVWLVLPADQQEIPAPAQNWQPAEQLCHLCRIENQSFL